MDSRTILSYLTIRDETCAPCLGTRVLTTLLPGKLPDILNQEITQALIAVLLTISWENMETFSITEEQPSQFINSI